MTSDFSAAVENLNAAKIRRNFGTAKFLLGKFTKIVTIGRRERKSRPLLGSGLFAFIKRFIICDSINMLKKLRFHIGMHRV